MDSPSSAQLVQLFSPIHLPIDDHDPTMVASFTGEQKKRLSTETATILFTKSCYSRSSVPGHFDEKEAWIGWFAQWHVDIVENPESMVAETNSQ